MAANRRAIFSSYVIPKESVRLEEGIEKLVISETINRTLGGKGTVTLSGSQWGESWSSFQHPGQYWEACDNDWEDMGEAYNGVLTVDGATQLNPDAQTSTTYLLFLYVKNLGTSYNQGLKLSLNGGVNYGIYIPPQGSIHLRGIGNLALSLANVRVDKTDQTTSVEFIIAK